MNTVQNLLYRSFCLLVHFSISKENHLISVNSLFAARLLRGGLGEGLPRRIVRRRTDQEHAEAEEEKIYLSLLSPLLD